MADMGNPTTFLISWRSLPPMMADNGQFIAMIEAIASSMADMGYVSVPGSA